MTQSLHPSAAVPLARPARPWRGEIAATVTLAMPLAVTQLGQIAMQTTDTVMMGWLGAEALAAGLLGGSLHNVFWLFCLGVLISTAALVAQARGARDFRGARRTVRQGLWIALLLAVPCSLMLWQTEAILLFLQQESASAAAAQAYVRAEIVGFAPSLGFIVLRAFAAGLARPRPALAVMLIGALVNVAFNYVLMFGHLGFPALGLVGAGIATAAVQTLMFLALLGYLLLVRPFRHYHIMVRFWRPDWAKFRDILRLGIPVGLTILCESTLFSATAVMVGWIGTEQLAAHAIAIQCASVTFMIPLGIGQAGTVRVGFAAGRGDLEGVRRAGWSAIGLGIGVMCFAALLFLVAPELLISVFLDTALPENAEILRVAVMLLAVAAAFQIFDGGQVTGVHVLRGLSDTRGPMVIAVVGYWVVGLGSALLLGFPLGLGAAGIWLGLVIGLAFAAVALIWRFAGRVKRGELPAIAR